MVANKHPLLLLALFTLFLIIVVNSPILEATQIKQPISTSNQTEPVEWGNDISLSMYTSESTDVEDGLLLEEEEDDDDDEDEVIYSESEMGERRSLFWRRYFHYYISYGALAANRIPCPPRSGRSYYTHNCFRATTPVNPYTRGCSRITRCRR